MAAQLQAAKSKGPSDYKMVAGCFDVVQQSCKVEAVAYFISRSA